MIRILALLLALGQPALAQSVSEQAQAASSELQNAVAALQEAEGARDRVSALTRTIKAYEAGLATLRQALRQVSLRETQLTLLFEAKRDRVAQLIGVLSGMDPEPGPLLLLHPAGPLGTVRSGMLLADVTPALQAEAEALRAELQELRSLRDLQVAAGETLTGGLQAAQSARTALSQAISDRTTLPKRFTEDPEVLRGLLESADTLEAFVSGLAPDADYAAEFTDAMGALPLPVLGRVLLRPGETDAAGVVRPGLTLATRAQALVTAPWAATIRYIGPLLDYGNVMILEPGGGYLLIFAGLETVYGEVGEVIAAGAPVGMMGGAAAISTDPQDVGGADGTETLYLELRQGTEPVDPRDWFTGL